MQKAPVLLARNPNALKSAAQKQVPDSAEDPAEDPMFAAVASESWFQVRNYFCIITVQVKYPISSLFKLTLTVHG